MNGSEGQMGAALNRWAAVAGVRAQVCICGGLRMSQSEKDMISSEQENMSSVQGSDSAEARRKPVGAEIGQGNGGWQVHIKDSSTMSSNLEESTMHARLSERDLISASMTKEVRGQMNGGAYIGAGVVVVTGEREREKEIAARRKRVIRHIKRLGVSLHYVMSCYVMCVYLYSEMERWMCARRKRVVRHIKRLGMMLCVM
jgi:hypothetical protein